MGSQLLRSVGGPGPLGLVAGVEVGMLLCCWGLCPDPVGPANSVVSIRTAPCTAALHSDRTSPTAPWASVSHRETPPIALNV